MCASCVRADSELTERAGKALLPGFGDDDDQEELIAQTGDEVSQLFKDCERRLKELGRAKGAGATDEVSITIYRNTPVASLGSALSQAYTHDDLLRCRLLPTACCLLPTACCQSPDARHLPPAATCPRLSPAPYHHG